MCFRCVKRQLRKYDRLFLTGAQRRTYLLFKLSQVSLFVYYIRCECEVRFNYKRIF